MPTTTLRPTGEADIIEWLPSSGSDNALLVDESSADDSTTYVYLDGTQLAKSDAYNHGGGVPSNATSISVEVFGRYATLNAGYVAQLRLGFRIGGVNYPAPQHLLFGSAAWFTYSDVFATNPATSAAWTPAEVNAAALLNYLQVVSDGGSAGHIRCTQLYAVVTYSQPQQVSLAGSLPAMSGVEAEKYKIALLGNLPAQSSELGNNAPVRLAGSLPSMSATVAGASNAFADVLGRLTGWVGTLATRATIAIRGNLPAQSGEQSTFSTVAITGSLPAMTGGPRDFTITREDRNASVEVVRLARPLVARLGGGKQEVRKL